MLGHSHRRMLHLTTFANSLWLIGIGFFVGMKGGSCANLSYQSPSLRVLTTHFFTSFTNCLQRSNLLICWHTCSSMFCHPTISTRASHIEYIRATAAEIRHDESIEGTAHHFEIQYSALFYRSNLRLKSPWWRHNQDIGKKRKDFCRQRLFMSIGSRAGDRIKWKFRSTLFYSLESASLLSSCCMCFEVNT